MSETISVQTSGQQALIQLARIADSRVQWLRYTDGNGDDIYFTPEELIEKASDSYYQRQNWHLTSPLDLISEKAEILRVAHDQFQRARARVHGWYTRRAHDDAQADDEQHTVEG